MLTRGYRIPISTVRTSLPIFRDTGKGLWLCPGSGHRPAAAQQVSAGPARTISRSWRQTQPQSLASSRWLICVIAPSGGRLQTGPCPAPPYRGVCISLQLPKPMKRDGSVLGSVVSRLLGVQTRRPPGTASPWLRHRPHPPARQRDCASSWAPGVQMLSPGSPVRGCWPRSRSRLSELTSSAYN